MTEQVSGLAPWIMKKAADVAAWRWRTQPQLDLGEVLWTTAAQALTELAGQLRVTLDETVASLKVVLLETSVALRVPDPPSMNEISTHREMPVFHMNREQLLVSKPPFARLFGYGTLSRRAQKELTALRPALEKALHSYSQLLRGWSERALSAVEQQFNAYADQYRAQMDRLLTGRKISGGEANRLQSDLESLAEPFVVATEPDAQMQALL